MRKIREPGVQIKTPEQLAVMWEAGQVVAAALRAAAAAVAPGVSTADLDDIASEQIVAAGAVSSFLGYHGYPATICASVNNEIVHGIPSASRVLREGDVVSIDCGASVRGWHADAALTIGVGTISAELTKLLDDCERALWQGMAAARPGAHLSDISHAVERCARAAGGYGIVEDYVGHGIGTEMHMNPPIPNYGKPGRGPVLAEGMALAIEPLLVLGSPDTRLLDDGWTVVSDAGGWSAHFEHTVAITAAGLWVLTASASRGDDPPEPPDCLKAPRDRIDQGERPPWPPDAQKAPMTPSPGPWAVTGALAAQPPAGALAGGGFIIRAAEPAVQAHPAG